MSSTHLIVTTPGAIFQILQQMYAHIQLPSTKNVSFWKLNKVFLQVRMLYRLELILPWHPINYICLQMLKKTAKFSTRRSSWLAKIQITELPNMKQVLTCDIQNEFIKLPPSGIGITFEGYHWLLH